MNEIVVMPIQDAIARYNAVLEFTKTVMKAGKDYGVIPGTDKPTLLKPGAEKLCSLFHFVPEFVMADEVKDFESGLFYFRYICKLTHGGELVATGEGSANNKEKKYRWRSVFANQATEEDKQKGRLETKKARSGSTYQVYVVENTEPFDLINTLQKMAQKRALIAAILIAANASEFYTQDMDDVAYIDADIVDEPAQSEPKAKTEPVKTPAPKDPERTELVKEFSASFNAIPASRKGEAKTITGKSTPDEIKQATEHNKSLVKAE